MTIEYRQGDLFASGLPAIAHGVNCRGVMGAGIARSFAERYPVMRELYELKCKLGHLHPGEVLPYATGDLWIFNLATQLLPGRDARPWAITASVGTMIMQAAYELGISQIGLPMIGCGIGGLDPSTLRMCLRPFERAPVDLIIYIYAPPGGSA